MQSIHNERLRRNKVKAIERKSNKYICDTKYTRTKHFLLDQVIVLKVRMFQGNTEDVKMILLASSSILLVAR